MGTGRARRGASARARLGTLAPPEALARARRGTLAPPGGTAQARRDWPMRARRGKWAAGAAGLAVLALAAGACTNNVTGNATAGRGGARVVDVVAAENFWGSLVSQLGGTHVNVLSIVSDPNADPHDYET